jgi:hypothetical protein
MLGLTAPGMLSAGNFLRAGGISLEACCLSFLSQDIVVIVEGAEKKKRALIAQSTAQHLICTHRALNSYGFVFLIDNVHSVVAIFRKYTKTFCWNIKYYDYIKIGKLQGKFCIENKFNVPNLFFFTLKEDFIFTFVYS